MKGLEVRALITLRAAKRKLELQLKIETVGRGACSFRVFFFCLMRLFHSDWVM